VEFLKDLNSVQKEAVTDYSGPHLVIAGAGSGKTRVLTYRIAYLLHTGIPAGSVMALTFTNKAAGEMKERINRLIGQDIARYLWIGTFHSIFSRILRAEAPLLGHTSAFTIYDNVDSKRALKKIIGELSLDDRIYKPGEILGAISRAKNNLITAGSYGSNTQLIEKDKKSGKKHIADIYRIYAERCFRSDAMDFDDLLLKTNILLRDHPEVLKKYQERFRYILVDEFQDTNFAQYLIISRLASPHRNICVVGDDAQSIYAFRGARIENILNFKKEYPGYKIFKLEQNYRSTKTIVKAANSLIEKNRNQLSKRVWSDNEPGGKIKVLKASTDTEEGIIVAREITGMVSEKGARYRDFAVLYRTNAQSRIFEETLRRNNIPYKVFGSLSFYQRKEIKDLLAYFRLSVNQKDSEALLRIINSPARGIGKTTLEKLSNYASKSGLSLWETVSQTGKFPEEAGLNRGMRKKLSDFAEMIKSFSSDIQTEDAHEKAMKIASSSGMLKDLFNPGSPENISKYENIQELLNGIKEFSESQAELNESTTLPAFLENVALLTDTDREKPEDGDKVSLMTVHSAKGLEFKHVFVSGMEEELFPGRFSSSTLHELEEERRLFYVALTRAEKSVTLSFSQSRYRWGSPIMCSPSRFLSEIDEQYLEYPDSADSFSSNRERAVNTKTEPFEKIFKGNPRGNGNTSDILTRKKLVKITGNTESRHGNHNNILLKPGMLVEHRQFGPGKVLQVTGSPPDSKAIVHFQAAGQKQLLLKFARLKIID